MAVQETFRQTAELADSPAGTGTRERIIAAAERMFAEQGFTGTSLRAIVREAGVNSAAIHYHYGSKKALFAAVIDRLVPPLDAARLRRLETIECGRHPPTVNALVEAFFQPYFDLAKDREHGLHWIRLIWRSRLEPGEHWQGAYARAPVMSRYVEAFCRAIPALTEEDLAYRLHFVMGATDHAIIDDRTLAFLGSDLPSFREDPDGMQEWLLTFITAVLQMPPLG